MVGDSQRHRRVLLDQQNRHALRIDPPYRFEHLLDQHRRQPHARLVHQQHAGRAISARAAAASAARRRTACPQAASAVPQARKQCQHLLPCPRQSLADRAVNAPISKFSLTVKPAEDAPPLRHLHHADGSNLVRTEACKLPAVEADLPLSRMQQAADRTQRGRIAGAVAAHERDDLPLLHGKRDAFQRLDIS